MRSIPGGSRSGRGRRRWADWHVSACLVLAGLCMACGKKGPPLPPLIRVPAPPVDFSAERRGAEVALRFTVPAANTDGTRPANIERLDVLRYTGPLAATDDEIVKLGTRVASVPVKAPQSPDIANEPDEPAEEPELTDEGLDQGAVAQVEDTLDAAAAKPVELPVKGRKAVRPVEPPASEPLLGPPPAVGSTMYVIVGINTKGRRGPISRRVLVPLVSPPEPPTVSDVTYDENSISVTWTPPPSIVPIQPPASGGVLPARTFGWELPTYSYHVYDVSPSASPPPAADPAQTVGQVRLTGMPIEGTSYSDRRIEWGATRCYSVRTVETFGDISLESNAPKPQCQTLKDTFPPVAPKDLRVIATERTISLIWEGNSEADLAGYLVFRGTSGDSLQPLTSEPITATTFVDGVASGTRFSYAIRAVDRAGNVGPFSNTVEETAR